MNIAPASLARYFERRIIVDEQGRGWLDCRLAPGGTAELTNIEVGREHRRKGVGRRLLARMIADLPAETHVVYAFTARSNRIAQDWYRAVGFCLTLLPGFYAAMNDDAYCCVKKVDGRADSRQ